MTVREWFREMRAAEFHDPARIDSLVNMQRRIDALTLRPEEGMEWFKADTETQILSFKVHLTAKDIIGSIWGHL